MNQYHYLNLLVYYYVHLNVKDLLKEKKTKLLMAIWTRSKNGAYYYKPPPEVSDFIKIVKKQLKKLNLKTNKDFKFLHNNLK